MAYDTWDMNRLGALNGADNPLELFKIEYGLQVMRNFKKNLLFGKATKVKTLSKGKAYEWPLLSDIGAKYHTPGNRIAVDKALRGTRTIFVDDTLVSATQVAEIDELMNHTDEMSQYSEIMGYELAKAYDLGIAAEVIKGALIAPLNDAKAASTNIGKGGNIVELKITGNSDAATDAGTLLKALIDLAKSLDEKEVPRAGRTIVLKPAYYWLLFNHIDLLNTLHPGIGNVAEGNVMKLVGFNIEMSTNIPEDNSLGFTYEDGTTAFTNHDIPSAFGDASNVKLGGLTVKTKGISDVSKIAGIFYMKGAVGTVKLKGLAISAKFHDDYLATLLSARYIVGHGWLNPVACGILVDNDPDGTSVIIES